MRPGVNTSRVGLSRFFLGFAIPFCCWGLISTLVLHLIELRGVFLQGGENRLRLATLAFGAAVILIQRMSYLHGRSVARAYSYLLGVAIALFSLHNAFIYRLPAPWPLVFLINVAIFSALWWTGHRISSACSVDSDSALAAAGETGMLQTRRKRKPEAKDEKGKKDEEELLSWAERLPTDHPGRVILYFSLFAVPAFGFGVYFFGAGSAGAQRLGILLFGYLWFATSLLFLSSLSQVRAYFDRRGVSLPEEVGLTWLAIGFFLVTTVLVGAFFLPQPPSSSTLFVRERIVASYRGWESKHGLKDSVGREPAGAGDKSSGQGRPRPSEQEQLDARYAEADRLGDDLISEVARAGQAEQQRNVDAKRERDESFRELVDGAMKVFVFLGAVAGLIVLYVIAMSLWRGMAGGLGAWAWRRKEKRRKPARRKKRDREEFEPIRFAKFANPFLGSYGLNDGNEIVRYLWGALVAYAADCGEPCPPDRTPLEFVESRPESLEGFEDHAEFIATLYGYSEFSGRPIPEDMIPRLKQFWLDLERHASHAA